MALWYENGAESDKLVGKHEYVRLSCVQRACWRLKPSRLGCCRADRTTEISVVLLDSRDNKLDGNGEAGLTQYHCTARRVKRWSVSW